MSGKPFVHLRVRSEYSILTGVPSVSSLVSTAQKRGFDRIALTDFGVMFGAIEFQEKCKKQNIEPIHGIELQLEKERGNGSASILVFPINLAGYRSLCRLIADHYQSTQSYPPAIILRDRLFANSENLIVLSGFHESEIGTNIERNDKSTARRLASEWKEAFGDRFYLELQDFGRESDELLCMEFDRLSEELGIQTVVTNGVKYLNKDDAETLDLMHSVGERLTLMQYREINGAEHGEAFLKTSDEMYEWYAGREAALERSVEIANRIDFKVPTGKVQMPRFPIPTDASTDSLDEFFEQRAREGLESRIGNISEEYRKRLDYELDVVKRTGFSGYFLIVDDFIAEARKRGVPVGPGRGSVAGSLAAYALHITHLDPIEYDLIFERFLNPERVSAPDMDIDFADDSRGIVIEYVRERYGASAVSQIATFGTMKAKAAIRDAGRVLAINLTDVERLANAYGKVKPPPDTDYFSIAAAIETDADMRTLVESNPEYARLVAAAKRLEGRIRTVGTHAAGVVIAPGDLAEYLPLYRISGGELISQYDKDVIEKAGLLKMDMLGLTMLQAVRETVRHVEANPAKYALYLQSDGKFALDAIPLTDEKTLDLFGKGLTVGVFQFESSGMARSLIQLKPSRLGDLIAMNALYRPGPMQRIPDFIACKQGRQQIEYIHPLLEPILKDTYGVIVYQEQVMLIAREVGGFSMSKADTLRKAMGKKDAKLLETLHPEFIAGARANGLTQKQADELYDQILKFSNYGFNKSHSAGYSYLAYQTGYLKAHFPAEFLAASLTSNMGKPDRVIKLLNEARRMGIAVLPPDVNYSNLCFEPTSEGIRFGLAAIKNVGEGAVRDIIQRRQESGQFLSLFDLAMRIDLRLCNKKVFESLVNAGACDVFGERSQLLASIGDAIEFATLAQRSDSNEASLFGESTSPAINIPVLRSAPPMAKIEQLEQEKKLVGYYISGHPLDDFQAEIGLLTTDSLGDAEEWGNGKPIRIACVVNSVQRKSTKDGKYWALTRIEDFSGASDLLVFNNQYTKYLDLLVPQKLLLINGTTIVKEEEEAPRIRLESAIELEKAIQTYTKAIQLRIPITSVTDDLLERFNRIFSDRPGETKIEFILDNGTSSLRTRSTNRSFRIDHEGLRLLSKIVGKSNIHLVLNNH